MHKIWLKKKKWLLLKPDFFFFLIVVSGIHEKVVKSDVALVRPRSRLLGPHRWLLMLLATRAGKKGMCREGEPARLTRKAAPAEGGQGGRLGENTS